MLQQPEATLVATVATISGSTATTAAERSSTHVNAMHFRSADDQDLHHKT